MRPMQLVALTTAALLSVGHRADAEGDAIARGGYLARIMDCAGCHMPRGADGAPVMDAGLSGGNIGFEIPGLGIFWPPNLTPSTSGLGDWTDTQIADAIRTGQRPDGRLLAPAMPWPAYAELSDEDVAALVAYLRSLPPTEAQRLEPVAASAAASAPFYRVTMPAN
ncbi:c-type cytochrome [Tropicimonas sediminicola]|uniref:Cytochrome C oxidase, cbb3-type, subunit III n=1 Tax=Tropicimonas sediminicola TaxID=1031541 RepID=A0A239L8Z4_9RHOB|nr:cytochrome c [Tropicimonas sediminicola]SNT27097.1 Cytochrome C oxidase, cbb3-type, subunit III [Tropicimonas sediminicola]